MSEIIHGRSGFWAGCRCDVCKADNRLWRKERADRIRAGLEEPSKHGVTGYAEGCRCEICVDASRAYHRNYQATKRQAPRPPRGLSIRLKLSRETLDAADDMAKRAGTDRLTELHRIILEATGPADG